MPSWYDDADPQDYADSDDRHECCPVCGWDAHRGPCYDNCGLTGAHDVCTHLTPEQATAARAADRPGRPD